MLARLQDQEIQHPGLASAHSHAFQRALRSHCQRQHSNQGSFWSWRGSMYALAQALDPESMYQLARFAYAELAMAGVTAVGEFHYVHHQLGGTPYQDRTMLAKAVIQAATDVGIRIHLQRVIYQRAGLGLALEPGQERFVDDNLEDALDDVETLQATYAEAPLVNIGLAVHSVRAVSRDWIRQASAYAGEKKLMLHMHLSEQQKELEECVAEHGVTPVQMMADDGVLGDNFVAVHATHLSEAEIKALGDSRSFVCLCRTTERDLGDGHCDARGLLQAGARLCTGVDSHAVSDPYEECRAIELDQRTRDQGRTRVANASELLAAATHEGYAALGLTGADQDDVTLYASDPALVGFAPERLDDAIVFSASPRAVKTVRVAGNAIVTDGVHHDYKAITQGYQAALEALGKRAILKP